MREIRTGITDIDDYLETGLRAKQALDSDRWRREIRPRQMRQFAAHARRLTWSRALVKAIVEELHPDDLFAALVGTLDRIPPRQWPWVLASAVALRHSWRRDGLTRLAQTLRVAVPANGSDDHGSPTHSSRPSPSRLGGSPRRRQGAPRCGAPAKRGLRP
jgi:hypothetical protein